MFILRPHELEMIQNIIDRSRVTPNVARSHGEGVARRIMEFVHAVKADPELEIQMGIVGNYICGTDCQLLANGDGQLLCESNSAAELELQALWAKMGYGYLLGHVFLARELFNLA